MDIYNSKPRQIRKSTKRREKTNLRISLRDKKRKEWMKNKTKAIDVVELAVKLKWEWADHNGRFQDEHWNNQIGKWCPYIGKR